MSVVLLTCCHKESEKGALPILTVQAGAALCDQGIVCDRSDADGENISALNREYNELTVLYWAWKNYEKIGAPTHIGLMHYRRYFYLDEKRKDAVLTTRASKGDFREKARISAEGLEELLSRCDFLCPRPARRASVRKQYALTHDGKDLEILEEVVRDLHPEMLPAMKEYLDGKNCYFFNMFVFPREIFFRYCDFVFSVLEEYRRRIGKEGRLFVSERLTGAFLSQLMKEGKKAIYLPVLYREEEGEGRFARFRSEWEKGGAKGKLIALGKLLKRRKGECRRV